MSNGQDWVPQQNPGPMPTVTLTMATQYQISVENRRHKNRVKEWPKYDATERVLKAQLIEVV